ncbi:GNAT family N-acetyltransferase [Dyadobacter flavalbus]|nr:GNAT family N-acetyltransferase [Dyadobacter flavalbus]
MTIKTAPSAYDLKMHIFYHNCYMNAGFIPESTYSSHFIPVSPVPFCNRIAAAERRRLRKAVDAKFISGPDSTVSYETAYEFIQECRLQKGYAVSVPLLQMQLLLNVFPDHFQIFTVKDTDRIIALSLTVRVNERVLYNFLPADLCSYRQFSPTVLLLETIYRFCQEKQISMLDLGISADGNGIHKPSLSRFKQNVGGEACVKITYSQKF